MELDLIRRRHSGSFERVVRETSEVVARDVGIARDFTYLVTKTVKEAPDPPAALLGPGF